jgi:hypothetical protein
MAGSLKTEMKLNSAIRAGLAMLPCIRIREIRVDFTQLAAKPLKG